MKAFMKSFAAGAACLAFVLTLQAEFLKQTQTFDTLPPDPSRSPRSITPAP